MTESSDEGLVQPEGVNAGSAASTGDEPDRPGRATLGGGHPQDAPGPWADQDEEDGEQLAGAPAEASDGQDEGLVG